MKSIGQFDLYNDILDISSLTTTKCCARLAPAMSTVSRSTKPKTMFRDPAFMGNRRAPIHRWVPWIAGFSGQFIQDAFREFLPKQSKLRRPLVLDPFAGVGTTLVEALLHGYDTVGFEINPYASLAARVKLSATELAPAKIVELIQVIRQESKLWKDHQPNLKRYRPTEFVSRIPFFSERIEPQILNILRLLDTYSHREVADLGRIALGAVLVGVSNYSYEPSLSSRPGAGKPLLEDADVASIVNEKLEEILADVRWLHLHQKDIGNERREVYTKNFLAVNGELPSGSVDLMITSPPYMNNYHYIRNTRPHLFWLSLVTSPRELHRLEEDNFGKFWQTVRNADPISLTCEHHGLKTLIAELREIRTDAGAYGGEGWANYVTTYFNDCNRFVQILRRVLRRGGAGVIVIGNSIIQGLNIATDRILADIAETNGLRLERIVPLREKRVGASITKSSVRRGLQSLGSLYESAVILRKR